MLKKPKIIPKEPGVYIFRKGKTPLYVGKAASLVKRVSSYFKKNPGWKVAQLINEADKLEFIKLESEIAALIKEAELIKTHVPKFNILMRDDKSYLYIGITAGPHYSYVLKNMRVRPEGKKRLSDFPRFYFTHQPERGEVTIGPFVEAGLLYDVMRLMRQIFPFCSCKQPHKGTCVNAEISKCPGYCCSLDRKATEGEIKHYRKNIEAIISVLSGKRNAIITELKHEMKEASKSQAYERAAKARDQIYGLESMYRHRGIALKRRGEVPYHKIERVLNTLFNAHRIKRVEGYDISNISGADSTGSMVVFSDGRPDKSQYRKFKVKTIEGPNDVGSQKEVLRRRLTHEEWQFPDLVLIDGGLPQLRAVATILTTPRAREIKLGALAKPPRRFFSRAPSGPGQNEDLLHILGRAKPVAVKSLPQDVRHFLQRVRDESHRFAKSYHSLLRKKSFAASR